MAIDFYWLKPHDMQKKYASWIDTDVHFESAGCSINTQHLRIARTPLNVILPCNNDDDFIWTWYSELLVKSSVLEFFKNYQLTGYISLRAKAKYDNSCNRLDPPILYEFRATGWGGIATVESGVRLLERCPECGQSRYSGVLNPSKLIDPAEWAGDDFFMVWPLPRFIFLSRRAADILRIAQFTGAEVVPVSLLTANTTVLGPGRLRDWMEPERAKLLEELHGIV